jgi:membrane protein YqaA with SNARE-associated domain
MYKQSIAARTFARFWRWFEERSHSPYAAWWLGALAFAESSFFPIPPDILLVAMLSGKATRWVRLALITTAGSLLGALVGYGIGLLFFDTLGAPLVSFYGLTEQFARVGALYGTSTFWVVFSAAFTPIPFKVFVLAGGFFAVPFAPFMFAAALGRSMRFFLVAWLARRFGPRGAELFLAYFDRVTLVLVLVLIIVGLAISGAFSRFL